MMTKTNTSVPTLKLFGKPVEVPYRVTLLDYTYSKDEALRLGRGGDNFKKGPYNSNYKDLMGVLEDNGKTLKLSSRSQPVIRSFDVTTDIGKKEAEAAIKAWHDSVMGRGDYQFLAGKSKINLSSEVCRPGDKPASASSGAETYKPVTFSYGGRQFTLKPNEKFKIVDFKASTLKGGQLGDPSKYDIFITYNPSDEENPYTISTKGLTSGEYTVETLDDARAKIDFFKKRIKEKNNVTEEPL
jgi:hypothetical protein